MLSDAKCSCQDIERYEITTIDFTERLISFTE